MGLGHTELGQGITHALNDNRSGAHVGTEHLNGQVTRCASGTTQALNDTRSGHTVQGLPQVLKLGEVGHTVQGSRVY